MFDFDSNVKNHLILIQLYGSYQKNTQISSLVFISNRFHNFQLHLIYRLKWIHLFKKIDICYIQYEHFFYYSHFGPAKGEALSLDASVLLDRTIKAELIYFRGELMRVKTDDAGKFRMGQHVLINYLDKEFTIRVINSQDNDLFLFLPFSVSSNLHDPRRRYPRISVSFKALITDTDDHGKQTTIPVSVIDLSHKGLAFQANVDDQTLKLNHPYQLINFDLPLAARVIVVNQAMTKQGGRFGCEFADISAENEQNLRSFILYRQILGDNEMLEAGAEQNKTS